MTLYARSDLTSVIISAGSGGCGTSHARPVTAGAPAKVWQLRCPQCETVLKGSDLWAGTVADIPETPDETRIREDYEKRGAKDQDHMVALALGKLAGVDVPESLTRVVSGAQPHIPGTLPCAGGHPNPAGVKFCGECGTPMHQPAVPDEDAAPRPQAGPAAGEAAGPDLSALGYSELRRLAVSRGLPGAGTKAKLLARLQEAAAA